METHLMQAPTTVPAYEALSHDIKALGTEVVFGLMSDDTALLVTTLDSMGVRFHGARHENNAIAMAEGYAAATGRLGIVILGRGPATANGVHGAVYALRSGSRVLVVLGEASTASGAPNGVGPDTKAFNTTGVLHAAGYRTFMPTSPATARRVLADAVAATRNGAVALLLPMNVQFGQVEFDGAAAAPAEGAKPAPRPARPAAIRTAVALLENSRRPLFVAGLGAHRAGARESLIRLADKVGAGLTTTLKAKDMFRGHPFDGGIVGSFSHGGGRRLIEQADCIVVFGAGLNQRTTSFGTSLPADVPLIQVDSTRTHIGRWFHADVAVVADVRIAAEQLLEALAERAPADKPLHSDEMRRWLADFDPASEFEPADTPRTMDPRSLAIELDRLLPHNRNAVYDSGNFLQILPYVSVPGPDHIKSASDFSSIGMGFGTALGYARGTPERTTVFFVGDGSFLMTLGELETVVREDIPLVIVVMNDCAYGAELHYLKMRSMPVSMSVFPDIDYAPVAEAFGFQAATVRTLDELRALAPMLARPEGPILLDCKITASIAAPFLLETIEHERRKA
jgi:thiamine pyrophosphate-dependent acetolactate synthase large subunit-like protein